RTEAICSSSVSKINVPTLKAGFSPPAKPHVKTCGVRTDAKACSAAARAGPWPIRVMRTVQPSGGRKKRASSFTAKNTRTFTRRRDQPRLISRFPIGSQGAPLLDTGQALLPYLVELHRGMDIAQAILGDVPVTSLLQQPADVHAAYTLGLWGLKAKGFAVEIEIELSRGSLASAHPIKAQLLRQIAVGDTLIAIAQPILAR